MNKKLLHIIPTGLVQEFETVKCNVSVLSTGLFHAQEELFIIVSVRKKDRKTLIRFGTKSQVKQIINTYKKEKKFNL